MLTGSIKFNASWSSLNQRSIDFRYTSAPNGVVHLPYVSLIFHDTTAQCFFSATHAKRKDEEYC